MTVFFECLIDDLALAFFKALDNNVTASTSPTMLECGCIWRFIELGSGFGGCT